MSPQCESTTQALSNASFMNLDTCCLGLPPVEPSDVLLQLAPVVCPSPPPSCVSKAGSMTWLPCPRILERVPPFHVTMPASWWDVHVSAHAWNLHVAKNGCFRAFFGIPPVSHSDVSKDFFNNARIQQISQKKKNKNLR